MSSQPPSGSHPSGPSSNPYAASFTPAGPGGAVGPGSGPPTLMDNTLGLVGFILSLVGLFACFVGLVGAILGFLGRKQQPNGLAIAAIWIGSVATALQLMVICGYVAFVAVIIGSIGMSFGPMMRTSAQAEQAGDALHEQFRTAGDVLTDADAEAIVGSYSDGWGRPFRFERDDVGTGYTLRSAGPDGVFDTADDILEFGDLTERSSVDFQADFDRDLVPAPDMDTDTDAGLENEDLGAERGDRFDGGMPEDRDESGR